MSSVSCATRRPLSSGRCATVRMLWSRSASLISRMRMSFDIATSILRKLSAWRARAELYSTFEILVRPSTRKATSSPNRRCTSSTEVTQSSTVSCSMPAATVTLSSRRSSRMPATSRGWIRYGSPETRSWPSWTLAEKTYARWSSSRSHSGSTSSARSAMSLKRSNPNSAVESRAWASLSERRPGRLRRYRQDAGQARDHGGDALRAPQRLAGSAPLRRHDLEEQADRPLHVLVHHRVVEGVHGAELALDLGEAPRDHLRRVGAAPAQTALELAERGRQQEHEARVRPARAGLECALYGDPEQQGAPARERPLRRGG